MQAMRKCRGCGAEIPANAPFGHCPNCLLALGFGPLPDEMEVPLPTDAGGSRTFGEYELLEQIGRGGMGVIYKARQVTLNRLVALKMINAGELATPTMIQRFHLEAESAANLHHPNIVPIYETGEHQGQHFFSMELIDGVGLDRHIAPPEHSQATVDEDRLDDVLGLVAQSLVNRQEGDADRVPPDRWELEVDDVAQQSIGDLDQDPGAIAGVRLGPGGTAMLEVAQRG